MTTFTAFAQHGEVRSERHYHERYSTSKHGQSSIYGQVKATDGTPADYASVYLKGTAHGCVTDERGRFRMHAPAGEYTLVVSALGFETYEAAFSLDERDEKEMNLRLRPAAIELDGAAHDTPEAIHYDRERTAWLTEEFGIRVLRFRNEQVFETPDLVIEEIMRVADG